MRSNLRRTGAIVLVLLLAATIVSIMTRGPGPDWNRSSGIQQPVSDFGEVAARLVGGLGATHRGGKVIFSTSFEHGLNDVDITDVLGTGAEIQFNPSKSFRGGNSVDLTAGDAVDDFASLRKFFYPIEDSPVGVESAFCLNVNTQVRVAIGLEHYQPDEAFLFQVRIDGSSKELEYLGSADWVKIADVPGLSNSAQIFHVLKMIVDVKAGKYLRVILDTDQFEVNDDAWTIATGEPYYNVANISAANLQAGATRTIQIDDFVLTMQEEG